MASRIDSHGLGHLVIQWVAEGATTEEICSRINRYLPKGKRYSLRSTQRYLKNLRADTTRPQPSGNSGELIAAAPSQEILRPPLCPDFRALYPRLVRWRHQDTGEIVQGLSPIQDDFLVRAPVWRFDELGQRIRGLAIWAKTRKVYATSLCLGVGGIYMACVERIRCASIFQKLSGDVGQDVYDRMLEMLEEMGSKDVWPEDEWGPWPGIQRVKNTQSERSILMGNKSKWILMTAGSGKQISEQVGRAGTIHYLHLSEAASYVRPVKVWAAAKGAIPQKTGWLVCESTLPDSRDQWFADEYRLTRDGKGSFNAAYFYPWYRDENRRIEEDSREWAVVMTPEYAAKLGPDVLAAEQALGLDEEQIAWRRWNYFQGGRAAIREAKREYAEHDESPYLLPDVEPYLHQDVLDVLEARTRPPILTSKLASGWVGEIWARDVPFVVITTDPATKRGPDRCVALALSLPDRAVVGVVHGHATPKQHYRGIQWLLKQLGCEAKHRHVVAPERNKDQGLIADYLNHDRDMNFWFGVAVDPRTKRKIRAKDLGYYLGERNRAQFITALTVWLEGDGSVEEDEWNPIDVPSSKIVVELGQLTDVDGKIQADRKRKHHDDLAMALAGALWVSARVKVGRAAAGIPHRPPKPLETRDGIKTRGRRIPY